MRGARAKRLRRLVYGTAFSPRHRKYDIGHRRQITADERRQTYQRVKGRRKVMVKA